MTYSEAFTIKVNGLRSEEPERWASLKRAFSYSMIATVLGVPLLSIGISWGWLPLFAAMGAMRSIIRSNA